MNIYKFELKRNLKRTIILFVICITLLLVSLFNDLNPASNIEGIEELPNFLRGILVVLGFDTQRMDGSFLFINGFVMLIVAFRCMDYGYKLGYESSSKYDFLYIKAPREKIIRQKILAQITLVSAIIISYIVVASIIFLINNYSITMLLLTCLVMLLTSVFILLLMNAVSIFVINTKLLNILMPFIIIITFVMFYLGSSFDIKILSLLSPFYYTANMHLLDNQIYILYLLFIVISSAMMYLFIEKKYREIDVTN